jgi:excisionase family DNA binding protein
MMDTNAAITSRLLNIQQAAKYLGCAVWTLRDLEWRGELPSVRSLGRRLLFDVRDLDRLVERKKGGR